VFLPPGSEAEGAPGHLRPGPTADVPCAARHRIAARPRPRATPFAGCLTARFRGCAAWHGAMALRGRYDAEKRKWSVDARPRPGAVSLPLWST
jgi:hypothetical protein